MHSSLTLVLTLATLATLALAADKELPMRLFIFREDCYKLFFEKHDFTNSACIKLTLSKFVGFGIIAGSSILKVPQIVKIVNAKSVEGISKSLFYLEIVTLLHSSTYSIRQQIPFSIYGESLIILAQNVLIVLLFWVYSKEIPAWEKLVLFVVFSAYSFVLFSGDRFMTPALWGITQSSNMFIMILSKIPQIITNFNAKSTGQLSFFTFLLNFLGGIARLGTVILETNDVMYLAGFVLSVFLNGIIVAQFLLYWNTGKKGVETTAAPASKDKKKRTGKLD